jgi:hypothetical protein
MKGDPADSVTYKPEDYIGVQGERGLQGLPGKKNDILFVCLCTGCLTFDTLIIHEWKNDVK